MYLRVLCQLVWQDIDFAKIWSDMGVMNSLTTVHFIVVALGWDGSERKLSAFFFFPKYKWDLVSLVSKELS